MPRIPRRTYLFFLPRLLQAEIVPQSFVFTTLTLLKITHHVFCSLTLNWGVSEVFPRWEWGCAEFGEKWCFILCWRTLLLVIFTLISWWRCGLPAFSPTFSSPVNKYLEGAPMRLSGFCFWNSHPLTLASVAVVAAIMIITKFAYCYHNFFYFFLSFYAY